MSTKPKPLAAVRGPVPRPAPAPSAERVAAFIDEGRVGHPQASPDIHGHPGASRAPRSEAGTKVFIERASGRVRRRTMVYLSPDTIEALDAYCQREGNRERSQTIDEAVREYLARRARSGGE